MSLLRLTQTSEGDDAYRVEIALEGEGVARQIAAASFSFALTWQDDADLRWYLEDYLQWPQDPAPRIAARVEQRMTELGTDFFKAIFQANDDARELWSAARHDLASTRVEIVTEVDAALALAETGNLKDALAYAEAALRGFEIYGESAAEDLQRTRQLIERIRQRS